MHTKPISDFNVSTSMFALQVERQIEHHKIEIERLSKLHSHLLDIGLDSSARIISEAKVAEGILAEIDPPLPGFLKERS